MLAALLLWIMLAGIATAAEGRQMLLNFVCSDKNDLYRVVTGSGCRCSRYDSAADALDHAGDGSAVLLLADGYPQAKTAVDQTVFDMALRKNIKLYIEYPEAIDGLICEQTTVANWERCVVAGDDFGEKLPKMRILSMSKCHFIPMQAADPLMVIARVAGYDSAVFGIPDSAHPILFKLPKQNALVAATKLSGFVTGRYAPSADWGTLWEGIIGLLDPSCKVKLKWKPTVYPAYRPDDKLPADVERRAMVDGAMWYLNSGLLVRKKEKSELEKILLAGTEDIPPPQLDSPAGDGSNGILEGFSAAIDHNGDQRRRLPLRADCNTEVAMALAVHSMLNSDKRSNAIAQNLLRYVFIDSGMCSGKRADPSHPAYGLIAWGAISPAWLCANYGDDNARSILATVLAQACLGTDEWDEYIMRALLANLRTTGNLGFRLDRVDIASLEANGWKYFHDAETVNYSPHFESYLWACNIWAFKHTGYKPFLDITKNAIRMTIDAFPDSWRWNDTIERARMLLCLAWLIRVEDTPEHRRWLKLVADDLLSNQQPCGALPERFGGAKGGHYNIPATNEEYGSGETPLIQSNGDPTTDQLYSTGFALLGLHEAVAATGDQTLKAAEDKLAEYLCRIQVRSKQLPYINGSWFRAFDYERWDYWASSADAGWGAWSAETGWGPAWITAVLGLRLKNTCVWEITSGTRIADHFRTARKQLAENDGAPWIGQ